MEDDTKEPQTDQPTTRPPQVMDIQAPKSVAPPQEPAVAQPGTTIESTDTPVAAPPEVPQPAAPVEAPVPDSSPAEPATQTPATETKQPIAAKPPKKEHGKTPVFAISVAVLMAIVLGGFATKAYLDGSDPVASSQDATIQSPVATQEPAPVPVDDAVTAVDEAIGSDADQTNFNDEDLSDTTLGL